MINKIIILAGGISSRMREKAQNEDDSLLNYYDQANEKSKSMITLGSGNRPFLDYLLYNCREAGLENILIVIGENDQSIPEYYGSKIKDNKFHGLSISYAVQKIQTHRTKPRGTADALYQGMLSIPEWKDNYFLVVNSDNLYSREAMKLLRDYNGDMAWIDYNRNGLVFDRSRIERFATTKKDSEGFLTDIIEKPNPAQIEECKDEYGIIRVSMNLWRFYYDRIFPYLENCEENPLRREKELPSAVLKMVKDYPECMKGIPLSEHIPDLTSKDDLVPVKEFLREKYSDLKW
jgi:glucose-1-phosphate adenylyltransferase